MWYYESNQQPFGPVSKQTIADELKSGKITPQTRVWREGWPVWKALAETELAVLAGLTPPVLEELIKQPAYAVNPQIKKMNSLSLNKLFWWWFGLYLSMIPFLLISLLSREQTWAVGLLCIFEIPLLAGAVLQYVLVYKLWQIVQDGFARTTPGKAVGFLFIPFFNFYWWFVAFFGLSKDQNVYIDRHFRENQVEPVRRANPTIALGYIIFSWVYVIFYIVLMTILGVRLMGSGSDPAEITAMMQPYTLLVSILSLIQMTLMVVMFFDFFLTSKSILKAEENQPQQGR